ncbi:MAG: Fe-Mn family superoxide dismutase [Methylococcales bacterium]|nr:Fe-Mn family superoxide dismutase [Methylococcales bacterium]
MNTLSRRHFLALSSIATASALILPNHSQAKGLKEILSGQSGLVTGLPKPLRHQSIPNFLSAEQLTPHFNAHYKGALRGYLAADEKIQSGSLIANGAYGATQRARAHKSNSVLLHELYFFGMTLTSNTPSLNLRTAIEKRFGSMEKWANDFQACATSASGWAVLALHTLNGKLYNVVCDKHADGLPWMSTPLIALDVYEHAYYVDYKNNKADYIKKFMPHIDWNIVSRTYQLTINS